MTSRRTRAALAALLFLLHTSRVTGADQPQWGQAWTRNLVSAETNLPPTFDPNSGQNIRWSAPLGLESHSTPIIADGRVYIGTNNDQPRDPRHQGDRGVLMCFDEKSGNLLWQLVVPKREEDPYHDWPKSGISSPVTVERGRVYLVSNRGEVMCLDPQGLANGNDGPYRDEARHLAIAGQPPVEPGPIDADILWLTDLTREAGIWSHDAAHSSILIHGDHLYLNSGTGVDNTHKKIRTPDAPSLVVIDKQTGRLLARDREGIAPNIFHCTWASPSMGIVDGKERVLFAGGNGIVYGFAPLEKSPPSGEVATLRKLWQFDFDPEAPRTNVHRFNSNRSEGPSNIYGMPIPYDGLLYVAGGGDLFWGKVASWLKCIDPSGMGDRTTAAERWSYKLQRYTVSTPALHQGMVFIADCGRTIHCLDARTGQVHWTHETKGEIWASPYIADGKLFIGTRRGDFWVLAASKEKRILHSVELGAPISATATAANGTLYIATMNRLYAIGPNAPRP